MAIPPNQIAILRASEVLRELARIDVRSTVDLSTDGGICISFHGHDRYADIEFFNTGESLTGTMGDGGTPEILEVDHNRLSEVIAELIAFVRQEQVPV